MAFNAPAVIFSVTPVGTDSVPMMYGKSGLAPWSRRPPACPADIAVVDVDAVVVVAAARERRWVIARIGGYVDAVTAVADAGDINQRGRVCAVDNDAVERVVGEGQPGESRRHGLRFAPDPSDRKRSSADPVDHATARRVADPITGSSRSPCGSGPGRTQCL
jgi:hypothetical protein